LLATTRRTAVLIIITAAVIAIIAVSATFLARKALLFTARLRISVHPEIMVGKLMIIFGVDPVAINLGILRHFLVFLEHLGGIAPRTVINPVIPVDSSAATVVIVAVIIVPATTAASLTIIHQILSVLLPLKYSVFL
jgi:hypothetical protein